uniref:Protein S-acyltransferase n=1 Tax=Alexandrium catenella TaxID=2925 RepID=A0A7S1RA55_ALECA
MLTMFFGFHIWLMFKAMTTIEFCEKSLPKKDGEGSRSYDSSVYDLGVFGNVRAVLGPNVLLWFFPCSRPSGDGLTFVSEETRLTKEMESGKGIRRRTHQKTQRVPRRPGGELGMGTYDPRI